MSNLQLSPMRKTIVGVQFLFVAFGATVLVPLLVGLDPATALFTAGLGHLSFIWLRKVRFLFFWALPLPSLLQLSLHQSSGVCLERWQE